MSGTGVPGLQTTTNADGGRLLRMASGIAPLPLALYGGSMAPGDNDVGGDVGNGVSPSASPLSSSGSNSSSDDYPVQLPAAPGTPAGLDAAGVVPLLKVRSANQTWTAQPGDGASIFNDCEVSELRLEFLELLESVFGRLPVKSMACLEENESSPTLHFHCCTRFEPILQKKFKTFKFHDVNVHLSKMQKAQASRYGNMVVYLAKDGNYDACEMTGDVPALIEAKKKKKGSGVAQLVLGVNSGLTDTQLCEKYDNAFFMHGNKVPRYRRVRSTIDAVVKVMKPLVQDAHFVECELMVRDYLYAHFILKQPDKHSFHLLLRSMTKSLGKTTLLEILKAMLNPDNWQYNTEVKWQDNMPEGCQFIPADAIQTAVLSVLQTAENIYSRRGTVEA